MKDTTELKYVNHNKEAKMKNILIGIIIGIALSGLAWAAQSITWVNDSGAAMGTVTNPVYIQTN